MDEWMVIGRRICWHGETISQPVHSVHEPSRSVTGRLSSEKKSRTRILKNRSSTPRNKVSFFRNSSGSLKKTIRSSKQCIHLDLDEYLVCIFILKTLSCY